MGGILARLGCLALAVFTAGAGHSSSVRDFGARTDADATPYDPKGVSLKTEWLEAILEKAQALGLEVLSFDELDRP